MSDAFSGSVPAPDRLSALRRLRLLDTPREEAFDRLTRTASSALGAPISLITLIDEDRQFFKSHIGLPKRFTSKPETGLSHSFCQHVVASGKPLLIEDARTHPLVRQNPAIRDLGVIAYAGVPLRTGEGHVLGALCVINTKPQEWAREETRILSDLAAAAMAEIEWRGAREAEIRYRTLVETATAGVVTMDRNSVLSSVNSAAGRIFGYSAEELVGQSLLVVIPERYRQAHEAGTRRYLATGQRNIPWSAVELPGLTRSGREIPLEISFGIYEQAGEPVFTGIIRDISDRKRAETAIRDREERFHALVTATAQIVWTTGADGTFDGDQPDWSSFTGQTLEEYRSWGWLDAIHPDDRAHTAEAWTTAVAESRPYELRHRVRRHDGGYCYFSVRGVAVREADGSIREWVGTHTDITAQKRAEEEREFLIEASEVLSSSLDYESTLASVAQLAVAQLADWCGIDILADGEVRRVATAHRDPTKAALAERLQRYRLAPDAPGGAPRVIRTGEAELYAEIPEGLLETAAQDASHLDVLRELGLKSGLVVPLISRGEILGAISFVAAESGRRYGARDLELAEDLARRAAVAVDNARLFREADEARTVMEHQAVELEAQLEELQNQAMQLEESQAELEILNETLQQSNEDLHARTEQAERAQERIRESELSYRSLWESLTDLVYILDLDAHFLTVNDAVLRRYGYAHEEVLGSTPALLAAPGRVDLEATEDRIRKAIDGEPQRFEFWARTKGGEVFPKEVILTRGEYFGAPVVIAVGRDISAQKQAETKLAAAEAHYRRLVMRAPHGIFVVDGEGRLIELNPAGARIMDRPATEVLGHHFAKVVAPEDLNRAGTAFTQLISGEDDHVELELRVHRPSGERRLLSLILSAIRDHDAVIGIHGTARDITEERAREEEIRLLAAALEGLAEGVSVSRFDGQIIYANSTHGRILGYDRERVGLPNIKLFIPDDGEAQRTEEMLRAVAELGVWVGRVRRRRADDGRIVPLELIVGRVDRPGAESVVFNIARDVTEEVQKENQLRRIERLASVGTMIGGVAHELNNPLHAIRNFAEIMLFDERSADDAEALDIIRREADRAAKVVSDLRLFARQTQEERGERSAVDLNDIVRHVVKVRRYAMATRNIEIVEDLTTDLPPVWADRGEIEQVVLNLMVNAEQAMSSQEGERRIVLRTRPSARGAAVHVIDTGAGIPSEQLERIFDPFWTTKPPGEGTGLGLSLVHSIVHEHLGEIRVESAVGRGTTFTVDLPRSSASTAHQTGGEIALPQAPRRPLRILVVDDEEALRRSAIRYLTGLGHTVDTAADGTEALRLLGRAGYHVILSDLRMPGMDGETLLQRLRDRGEGLERRVIFLTGDAASAQAARVLSSAGVPVLVKPLRLEAIARMVEQVAEAAESRREEGT